MKDILSEVQAKEHMAKEKEISAEKAARAAAEKERMAREAEKVAKEAEKVAKAKVESLSVRLDDALNELETVEHRRRDLSEKLRATLVLVAEVRTERQGLVESVVASAGEVECLKKKVSDLEGENKDLEEENRQIEAFTRLTARAALMRRHLAGKNPMAFASASEELATYLADVGGERDLDSDDDKDASDYGGSDDAAEVATDPPLP